MQQTYPRCDCWPRKSLVPGTKLDSALALSCLVEGTEHLVLVHIVLSCTKIRCVGMKLNIGISVGLSIFIGV